MAGEEWEAVVGGSWLNKIGIVVLVIGVALFLGYYLRYMGPLGKVATGLLTSLILLTGGVALERVERYAVFGKPFIGGGWALLYFTTYAAHNIDAVKVIEEPIVGFLLLGLVASGMVLHSLKYRSEVVTGLAYFLAFLTVSISPLTDFSLVASAILAGTMPVILRTMRWQSLGLFGLAATYLNHLLWLDYRMGGSSYLNHAESFWLAQGMLVLYWLVFTAFAFVLKSENDKEEGIGLLTNAANTVAFLALSLRHIGIFYPEGIYLLTGFTGIAYAVDSYLMYLMGRRKLYLLNEWAAVVLIAVTFPLMPGDFPLSRDWLAIAWLVLAWAVLALGFYLKETVFRIPAYAISLAAYVALFLINLYGEPELPHFLRWCTVSSAIACFYWLSGKLDESSRRKDIRNAENGFGILCGYMASGLLAVLLWTEVRADLVGLAWLVSAILLAEAGFRFHQAPLRIQGQIISALAFCALVLVNVYGFYGEQDLRDPSRWLTVLPAIFAFYALFLRHHQGTMQEKIGPEEKWLADLSSYAASALFTVLLWKQLDAAAISLAWGFLGLLLFEAGIGLKQTALRRQGHVLVALALGHLFLANFTAPGEIFGLSHRLITVIPLVTMLYYLRSRVTEEQVGGRGLDFERNYPQAYSYAAALLIVILIRFEFTRSLAVMAWAVIALVFLTLGILCQDRDFRIQSYLIAGATFWRSWSTNFYLIGSYYGIPERLATTVPVIAAFYTAKALCLFKRDFFLQAGAAKVPSLLTKVETNAQALFSLLGTLLLTLLLYYEVQENLLTMTWTIEGFGLLALGFLIPERTFRLSGLSLLMVCFLKVFLIDLQGVETLYRIFSFIVLGIILLLVSFGYTKYKDVIKRYI